MLPNAQVAKDTFATRCNNERARCSRRAAAAAEQTLDKLHSVWSLIAPGQYNAAARCRSLVLYTATALLCLPPRKINYGQPIYR